MRRTCGNPRCRAEFETSHRIKAYCSPECQRAACNQRLGTRYKSGGLARKVRCAECGGQFATSSPNRRYCSVYCRTNALRNQRERKITERVATETADLRGELERARQDAEAAYQRGFAAGQLSTRPGKLAVSGKPFSLTGSGPLPRKPPLLPNTPVEPTSAEASLSSMRDWASW